MSSRATSFAQIPEVSDYLTYLNTNASQGWSIRGPNLYTPKPKIQAYFESQRQRLETLLQRVLDPKEFEDINVELIFTHYLIILTILLRIDKPDFLPALVRARLSDDRLPLDVEPTNFPPLATGSFFQEFRDAQWRFCPFVFRIGENDCQIEAERIIPIRSKTELRRRPPATVWKVVLHEDCDPFQNMHCSSVSAQAPRNTYIFKQFTGRHATTSYKKELKAFVHLYRYHRAQLGNSVIGFHGSFVHGDTPVLILEYAEYGSLQDFYETREPPKDGRQILQLWRAVLQLYKGICAIHNIAPVQHDDERFHSVLRGWHQDIKPGNILVTRGLSGADDDYAFRLADLGTTHFTRMTGATAEELKDADAGGTKAYGAPECYRTNHLAEDLTLRVGQAVDIWSLGAVLSEFAVWLVCGLVELNQYRRARNVATQDLTDLGCFHDGHGKLLPCVREFNQRAIDSRRVGDHVTKKVVHHLINGMLYAKSEARPNAIYLVQSSGEILDTAQEYLLRDQSSSPTTHNTPKEQHHYQNMHSSVPTLNLPNAVESSPYSGELRSSPPALTPTQYLVSSPPDTAYQPDTPVTPTPSQSSHHHMRKGQQTVNGLDHASDPFIASPIQARSPNGAGSSPTIGGLELKIPGALQEHPYDFNELLGSSQTITSRHEGASLPFNAQPTASNQNNGTTNKPRLTLDDLANYRHHMKSGRSTYATLPSIDCLAPLGTPARDFAFLIDDSASMHQYRDTITKAIENLSWLLKKYDDNGIDMYFMRKDQHIRAGRKSSSDLRAPLFTAMSEASGTSDITLRLGDILHTYCEDYRSTRETRRTSTGLSLSRLMPGNRSQRKARPLMLYVFTNALWQESSDPTFIMKDIAQQLDDMHAPWHQVGIQFISVGASAEQQSKLDILDRGLGLSRDMVDTEPIGGNVYKMLVGPISRKWDAEGEP